jgi:hypothetical protein
VRHSRRLAILAATLSLVGCGGTVADDAGLDASRADASLADAFVPTPACSSTFAVVFIRVG